MDFVEHAFDKSWAKDAQNITIHPLYICFSEVAYFQFLGA
jgi:hypothetical protein